VSGTSVSSFRSADRPAGDVRPQSGGRDTLVERVDHTVDLQRHGVRSRPAAAGETDRRGDPDGSRDEDQRAGNHREHDGAGCRHAGDGGASRRAPSSARLIDLDAHHRRSGSRVARTHTHAANQSESPFTGREAHGADGAPDDPAALGPHTPPIAQSVSAEVVAVDEPGVQAGKEIRRRPGHLGIDRDHGGTDEPVAHVMPRQRIESLDRECAVDCVRRDADLGGRLDEGPLTDASELGQRVLRAVGEITRPSKHPSNGLTIEELLSHRRSA
jgi:hypothetical protein